MKRLFTTFLAASMVTLAFGTERTERQAAQIASDFFNSASAVQARSGSARTQTFDAPAMIRRSKKNNDALMYAYNSAEGGFVIVSAEDSSLPILGYSYDTSIDETNIPENMQVWLQHYEEELEWMRANGVQHRSAQAAAATYTPIAPIMGTTWNQRAPFNNLCPKVNGTACPAGCVATAIAQVMYHHRYPAHGTGSHSYVPKGFADSLYADFEHTYYDWDNMLKEYKSVKGVPQYSDAQGDAVATLCYHLGVAFEMGYKSTGSGTVTKSALTQLTEYFDYDKGMEYYALDYSNSPKVLVDAIAEELKANRPAIFSASTPSGAGHCFVAEGIDAAGNIYINWGWGGLSNAYFPITAMNPDEQGVGGSSANDAYTVSVTLFTKIRPNQGGTTSPTLSYANLRTNAPALPKNKSVSLMMDTVNIYGIGDFEGRIFMVLYDENDSLAGYNSIYSEFSLSPGYYMPRLTGKGDFSSYPAGKYQLTLFTVDLDYDNLQYMHSIGGIRMWPVEITKDSVYFNPAKPDTVIPTPDPVVPKLHLLDSDMQTNIVFSNADNNCNWRITMYDKQFTDKSRNDQMYLSFTLSSPGDKSFVGSYRMQQQSATGSILGDRLMGLGNSAKFDKFPLQDAEVTIVPLGHGEYNMYYSFLLQDGQSFVGRVILQPNIRYLSGTKTYAKTDMDDRMITSISSNDVYAFTRAKEKNYMSLVPYFIGGIVNSIVSPVADIVSTGMASFYISEDGSVSNAMMCRKNTWIYGFPFETGTEFGMRDTIIVCDWALNYNAKSVMLDSGYVVEHHPYIEPLPPTALEPVGEKGKPVKFIENGRIYIRKGDSTYDLLGRKNRATIE